MAIYVLKPFDRNLKNDNIDDVKLCQAAKEVMAGNYEASLGGNVYKKRIPLNAGKSGGARAVVAFRSGGNLFFVNGYPKSGTKGSGKEIPDDVLEAYKKVAADLQAMTPEKIKAAKDAGKMREVKCDDRSS